jgi:hypothetical protein
MSKSKLLLLVIGVGWIIFFPVRLMVPAIWEQAQKAEKTTATTQGKVIAYNDNYHSTGTYEYWVNGARYEGSQSGMTAFPVGSLVPVYYDPQNPSLNYAIRPPPSLFHNLFGMAFLVMFMLVAVLFGVFGRWVKSKPNRTKPPPLVHH